MPKGLLTLTQNPSPNPTDISDPNPTLITTRVFSALPEGLINQNDFEALVLAKNNPWAVLHAMGGMPPAARDTLAFLTAHWRRVAQVMED